VAVHILYLTGLQNRALVLLQWAWQYLTSQLGARLILGAPATATSAQAAAAPPLPPSGGSCHEGTAAHAPDARVRTHT
jgi:hypothetical protein